MADLKNDPIINAIYKGIKRGIEVTLENGCERASIILIYAAMDTMAYLDMPAGKTDVDRTDFVRWAECYIRFPCREQLTGWDLYGARCATLHQYGAESKLSREGQCRVLAYGNKGVPEIVVHPTSKQHILVSLPALKKALFEGIDRFLIEVFSDKAKAKIVEDRLAHLLQS